MGALDKHMKAGLVLPVMDGYLPKLLGKVNKHTCHSLNLPTVVSGHFFSLKDESGMGGWRYF